MGERNCREMTGVFYPDKITVEEFIQEVQENLEPFKNNIKALMGGRENWREYYSEMWVECWVDAFRAWAEMEHKK